MKYTSLVLEDGQLYLGTNDHNDNAILIASVGSTLIVDTEFVRYYSKSIQEVCYCIFATVAPSKS